MSGTYAAVPGTVMRPTDGHGQTVGGRDASTLAVVVAESGGALRDAIVGALIRDRGLRVARAVSTSQDALRATIDHRPDCVLVDSALPPLGGLESLRRISVADASVNLLLLADPVDAGRHETQLAAVKAGAAGCIPKDLELEVLPRVVRGVASGEAAMSRTAMRELIDRIRGGSGEGVRMRPVSSDLTPREWEVLDLLTVGASTEEIAERLVLTVDTVYSHVKSILRKLGVHSRAEAVEAADKLRNPLL